MTNVSKGIRLDDFLQNISNTIEEQYGMSAWIRAEAVSIKQKSNGFQNQKISTDHFHESAFFEML